MTRKAYFSIKIDLIENVKKSNLHVYFIHKYVFIMHTQRKLSKKDYST